VLEGGQTTTTPTPVPEGGRTTTMPTTVPDGGRTTTMPTTGIRCKKECTGGATCLRHKKRWGCVCKKGLYYSGGSCISTSHKRSNSDGQLCGDPKCGLRCSPDQTCNRGYNWNKCDNPPCCGWLFNSCKGKQLWLKCVAGSSLENKMEKALTSCYGGSSGRIPRPTEAKRKCFTYEGLRKIQKDSVSDDETCLFQSIGWIDSNMILDNATIMADLNTFNSAVTEHFFRRNSNCMRSVNRFHADADKNFDLNMRRALSKMCDPSPFSSKQIHEIKIFGKNIGWYQCLHKDFKYACMDFLERENPNYQWD